jgi:hypothetical protein
MGSSFSTLESVIVPILELLQAASTSAISKLCTITMMQNCVSNTGLNSGLGPGLAYRRLPWAPGNRHLSAASSYELRSVGI